MTERMLDQEAHTALEAAGYRCYGAQTGGLGHGEILWQKRTPAGWCVNVLEWPPVDQLPETRYEVDAYAHDDRDAAHVKLYSYAPAHLVAHLADLERRVLAALEALEIQPEDA